ncbi:MAG: ABC transporter ATP-binding protein [Deltaproteobacteria bacterium]|nr:ABC transporter ATP-binding protein [Deltaproteobacteria bacterium]
MQQLEIKNLKKNFSDGSVTTEVLKGIDLVIEAGEVLSIVGASGAGKSTLLHIIGTLDTPSSGSVWFEGENLFQKKEKDLCAFRNMALGFIFQFHHLLPDFTSAENVMMPLLIRGEKEKKARLKAWAMLERVGLKEKRGAKPVEMSGGEQQRVAIARALIGAPRVVLADEPTGNLDTQTGRQVFDLLLSLNRELKTTLIVVTHNEELSQRLGKSVKLVDGKIAPKK